jgi:hypothetical protein
MGGRTRMINGPMDCPPKLSKTISNNGSGFSNIQNPVTRMMAPKTLNQIVGVPSSTVSVSFMSLFQSRMLLFIARHQIHLVQHLRSNSMVFAVRIPVRGLDDSLLNVRCCAVGAFTDGNHGDAVCCNDSVLPIFHIKDGF